MFTVIKTNRYRCRRDLNRERQVLEYDCGCGEIQAGQLGCGEACLNRQSKLECKPNCKMGDSCSNQRFQKRVYPECVVIQTEQKGFGLQTTRPIRSGQFIMEYVGEVLDDELMQQRTKAYSQNNNQHSYLMELRKGVFIDATKWGNISRFINHSCDPNTELQRWIVNGELRIGFFSIRDIDAGKELTVDYNFQRDGANPQKCFCGTENCRGFIGEAPAGKTESELVETGATVMSVRPIAQIKCPKRVRKHKNRPRLIQFTRREISAVLGARSMSEVTLDMVKTMSVNRYGKNKFSYKELNVIATGLRGNVPKYIKEEET